MDGVLQTAPYIANWPAGYQHVLEAIDPQTGGGGETYLFLDWDTGYEELIIYVDSDLTDTTVTANYLTIIQYAIPLHEGWNLISTPLYPLDDNLDAVLTSISGDWDAVQAWDAVWEEAVAAGLVTTGRIGNAQCHFFRASEMLGIFEHHLRTDPWALFGVTRGS